MTRVLKMIRQDSARAAVLAEANAVLATFRPPAETVRLAWEPGDLLRIEGAGWRAVAVVREDGTYFRHRRVGRHMGGTEEMATVQLVRWVRGQPRRPLRCWAHWCGHLVALGRLGTLDLLRSSSYPDPRKTACVLCGGPDPTDWWSLDGVTGPCCRFGRCRGEARS